MLKSLSIFDKYSFNRTLYTSSYADNNYGANNHFFRHSPHFKIGLNAFVQDFPVSYGLKFRHP